MSDYILHLNYRSLCWEKDTHCLEGTLKKKSTGPLFIVLEHHHWELKLHGDSASVSL